MKKRLAYLSAEILSYHSSTSEVDSLVYSNIEVDSPPASSSSTSSAVAGSPKPTVKSYLRADLGNHGRTSVPVKQGVTLRDALSKAMKLRKLTPETCAVYRINDTSKTPINWDTDMTQLDGEDIKVEVSENLPITTRISHNFVRKTFFSLAFCECCRKDCRRLLITGFTCRTCGIKFHQKCAPDVPTLCEQLRMQKFWAQSMLAREEKALAHIDIIMPGPMSPSGDNSQYYQQSVAKRGAVTSISSRDRSSSAPNVSHILSEGVSIPDQYRAPLRTAGGGIPGMRRLTDHVSPATSPTAVSSRSESNR